MNKAKWILSAAALFLPLAAQAQYGGYGPRPYPPPFAQQRPEMVLGTAHVDGPVDHDDIKVDRYAGRFHFVLLQVHDAPIRFDHVVIHYADGAAETLPVSTFIPPSGTSRWIALPGGERRIHSLELWYARAEPGNPIRPEVELFGAP
ncbi:hypothetical protein [Silvibacterium dinghuense]|uniref:Uncharacterized protein n=1 Tax=Silvibacterium dinghuense TaxID=1560006 RepID=A0A4Q1SK70_9BACT|nr:hypothetical protein [Silvibacterium dinghuense]RXS97857.1 hypothetical protein ESZ00_08360 [Silvibacterium dinghuense]GGH02544.1 hypothetical protein GCM10011586_17930 [Silvibacterium dinghuense]